MAVHYFGSNTILTPEASETSSYTGSVPPCMSPVPESAMGNKPDSTMDDAIMINGIRYVKADGEHADGKKLMHSDRGLSPAPALTQEFEREKIAEPENEKNMFQARVPAVPATTAILNTMIVNNVLDTSYASETVTKDKESANDEWSKLPSSFNQKVVQIVVGTSERRRSYFIHQDVACELFSHDKFADLKRQVMAGMDVALGEQVPGFQEVLEYIYAHNFRTGSGVCSAWDPNAKFVLTCNSPVVRLYMAFVFFGLENHKRHVLSKMKTDCSLQTYIENVQIIYESKYLDSDFRKFFKDNLVEMVEDILSAQCFDDYSQGSRFSRKNSVIFHPIANIVTSICARGGCLAEDVGEVLLEVYFLTADVYLSFENKTSTDEPGDGPRSMPASEVVSHPPPSMPLTVNAKQDEDTGSNKLSQVDSDGSISTIWLNAGVQTTAQSWCWPNDAATDQTLYPAVVRSSLENKDDCGSGKANENRRLTSGNTIQNNADAAGQSRDEYRDTDSWVNNNSETSCTGAPLARWKMAHPHEEILSATSNSDNFSASKSGMTVVAIEDAAASTSELLFRRGDMIYHVVPLNCTSGWDILWSGVYNGKRGTFPAEYVTRLPNHWGNSVSCLG